MLYHYLVNKDVYYDEIIDVIICKEYLMRNKFQNSQSTTSLVQNPVNEPGFTNLHLLVCFLRTIYMWFLFTKHRVVSSDQFGNAKFRGPPRTVALNGGIQRNFDQ